MGATEPPTKDFTGFPIPFCFASEIESLQFTQTPKSDNTEEEKNHHPWHLSLHLMNRNVYRSAVFEEKRTPEWKKDERKRIGEEDTTRQIKALVKA